MEFLSGPSEVGVHSAWDDYSDSPISFGFRVLAGSLLIRLKKALGLKWTIREN